MIFQNDEQKRYFAITLGLIVILLSIVAFNRTDFRYRDTTDYTKLDEAAREQEEAYRKILEAAKPDPQASRELFKQIVSEGDVRKQMEADLSIGQTVVIPVIPQSKLAVSGQAGKTAVTEYLRSYGTEVVGFNNTVIDTASHLFQQNQDVADINGSIAATDAFVSRLYAMQVPVEAIEYHKASIISFQEFGSLLKLAKDYRLDESQKPWPELYQHYSVVNHAIKISDDEFRNLTARYQLADVMVQPRSFLSYFTESFLPVAHAQLGGVTIIANIPEAALEALKKALATAFAQYATKFLDSTLGKIEQNYRIANYLYYSDALSGQYVNDYLNKYVADATDRGIISKFIPQLSCGQPTSDLRPIFQAKAREYLGFDPATIRPDDPDYLSKLFKVGTMGNDPNIWESTFNDLARQATSAAQDATTKELLGSGYKTARTIDDQIATTLGLIENAQAALFDGQINLGVNNVENIVGQLVTSVINNLFNKFLFNGAVVLKEQQICLATPQVSPILTNDVQ